MWFPGSGRLGSAKSSPKISVSYVDAEYWDSGASGDAGVDKIVGEHDRQGGDWELIEAGLEKNGVKEHWFPRAERVSVLTKVIEHYLVPDVRM